MNVSKSIQLSCSRLMLFSSYLLRFLLLILLSFLVRFFFSTSLYAQTKFNYPHIETIDQIDTIFGIKVHDPYRWLEENNSQQTKDWIASQQQLTSSYLAGIPDRDAIKKRLEHLWNYKKISCPFKKGNKYFIFKNNGKQNQSVLYWMNNINEIPTVLLDPNSWSDDGTVALSSSSISKNGTFIAYGKSTKGSDWVTFYVKEIATGRELIDIIEYTKFSGVSWYKDGFYYTKYDKPNEEKQYTEKNTVSKVYYHRIGTTQKNDVLVYEDANSPNRSYHVEVTESEKHLILYGSKSTENNTLSICKIDAKKIVFIPIIENFDNNYNVLNSEEDALIVSTNYESPNGKIIKINLNKINTKDWETLITEKSVPIEEIRITKKNIILNYLNNLQSKIEIYDLKGNYVNEISIPDFVIAQLKQPDEDQNILYLTYSSYVIANVNCSYNIDKNKLEIIHKTDVPFDLTKYKTEHKKYKSKDGTVVSIFIISNKEIKLNSQNPTMLYGYGGFNISILPDFSPQRIAFLEQGGVWAVANIRGGSEYGDIWHREGMLDKKQNVFDDFIYAAEYLCNEGYTNPNKLAMQGRSNGGLLVGSVMTQRPDICRVALPIVGVMDMIRYHKFTIGYFWKDEYGSSENKNEFLNLIKYSPLHNLKPANYPATLVMTGDHDDRVVPAHSYKFASQLQVRQLGALPCLIRIDSNAGHGNGKPIAKIIEEWTDLLAFTMLHLGVEYQKK